MIGLFRNAIRSAVWLLLTAATPVALAELTGNGVRIGDGCSVPSYANHTRFGSTAVAGTPIERTYVLHNRGDASLALTGSPAVAISGPAAAEFTVTTPPDADVPAGGSTAFTVRFIPAAFGIRRAWLTLGSNDPAGAQAVAIEGIGSKLRIFPNSYPLGSLTLPQGLGMAGSVYWGRLGMDVASAGDVNGDGHTDLIVGENSVPVNSRVGKAYVIFGPAQTWSNPLLLASLTGANGFRIDGVTIGDAAGGTVGSVGDLNGDGYDDLLVGAAAADPGGTVDAGACYVIFGRPSGWSATLALSSLNGATGFRLDGVAAGDRAGSSAAGIGDLNGDGFDDLAVGAPGANPEAQGDAGTAMILFGHAGAWPATLSLDSVDGVNGFRFEGGEAGAAAGCAVAAAGDVNGDGYPDLVVGADQWDGGSLYDYGECYVVFGHDGPWSPSLNPAAIDGTNGFRVVGPDLYGYTGRSVSTAGDINGDGYADLLIGSPGDPNSYAGRAYVLFGKAEWQTTVRLNGLTGADGFRLTGASTWNYAGCDVSPAGDVNGDGLDDILVGAYNAGTGGYAYLIYGKSAGWAASLSLSTISGGVGFTIYGSASGDSAGRAVASIGDANGDGYDDLFVGAPNATASSQASAGRAYVLFGGGSPAMPEINLKGKGQSIASGDVLPATADGTDFGTVRAGAGSVTNVFVIENTGTDNLELTGTPAVDIVGDHAADFAIALQPAGTVAAQSSTSYQVVFRPQSVGVRNATVSIANNDSNENPYRFAIRGTGVAPEIGVTGNGRAILSGDAAPEPADGTDFGYVALAGAILTRTFIITNSGLLTLSLPLATPVTLSGAAAGGFTVSQQPAATVAPGGSTLFRIAFDPTATGARSATVSIQSDDDDESVYTFAVAGIGALPTIGLLGNGQPISYGAVAPTSANGTDFGGTALNLGSVTRTFLVTNSGPVNLALTGSPRVSVSGPQAAEFTVSLQPAATVPAGASTSMTVVFNPAGIGSRSAVLSIASSDSDRTPFTFAVGGAGLVPSIKLEGNGTPVRNGSNRPSYVNHTRFGATNTHGCVIMRTFAIRNDGEALLRLTGSPAVTVTGAAAADFSVVSQPAATIATNSRATFTVAFNPSAQGIRSAGLRLTSDDPHATPYTFAVEGLGQSQSLFDPSIELDSVNGANGFRIEGAGGGDGLGYSVSAAGDVNGDGRQDFIVGAPGTAPGGAACIVFGRSGGWPASLTTADLDGSNGFRLAGWISGSQAGYAVSAAGDVNGDGIGDLIVGAWQAAPEGRSQAGQAYVVFGRSQWSASLDVASLSGSDGFRVDGLAASDRLGNAVSAAGDVNGDGCDDLLVSAYSADLAGAESGATWLIFGRPGTWEGVLDLSSLAGERGCRLDGATAGDKSGWSAAAAGDMNGDGYGDIVIGGFSASPEGRTQAGAAHVVFGHGGEWPASLSLSALDGAKGFGIYGLYANDCLGWSVGGGGDVNGDGCDDLLIGARAGDAPGRPDSGMSWIVYGRRQTWPSTVDLATLEAADGCRVLGEAAQDFAGSAIAASGDVNLDGCDDLIVGAPSADPGSRADSGAAYVVFGRPEGLGATLDLAALEGHDGFRLLGGLAGDAAGQSVGGGVDLNGDGCPDLLIGMPGADPAGRLSAGACTVWFGGGTVVHPEMAVTGNGQEIANGDVTPDTADGTDFGLADARGDGVTSVFVITNVGPGRLALLGTPPVSVTGADAACFTPAAELLDRISSGAGMSITITFVPQHTGLHSATVSIANDDGDEDPYVFALRGTGRESNLTLAGNGRLIARGDQAPSYGDHTRFGGVAVGGVIARTFIIHSTGAAPLRLSDPPVVFDGPHAGDFMLSAPPDSPVTQGGLTEFTVRFVPTAPGRRRARVLIGSDTAGGACAFAIEGAGIGLRVQASAVTLSSLNGARGFCFQGSSSYEYLGHAVSRGGDLNGDGFEDLVFAAPGTDGYRGRTSVLFGKTEAWTSPLGISSMNGGKGFYAVGNLSGDYSGVSVSAAGDINGDGYDDLLIGANQPYPTTTPGRAYVLFGRPSWSIQQSLANFSAGSGIRLDGIDARDYAGQAVIGGRDVNGDGRPDLIVGAPGGDPGGRSGAGECYVVFGRSGAWPTSMALSSLDGANGFRFDGVAAGDEAGFAVGCADINGDGLGDVLIGARSADIDGRSDAGACYVVFGSTNACPASLGLSSLNGTNGFCLTGIDASDNAGYAIAGAGDINGDGYEDVVAGAWCGDPDGRNQAGEAYVIFGRAGTWPATGSLAALDGTNGFRVDGVVADDRAGCSVAAAGDVNGDGLDDLIFGACNADPGGRGNAGASYMLLGRSGEWPAALSLTTLDGSNGFRIDGIDAGDNAGVAVAGAGDFNQDGFDDVMVGAYWATPYSNTPKAGKASVLFGGGLPGYRLRTTVSPHGTASLPAETIVAQGATTSVVYQADNWHRIGTLTRDGEALAAAAGLRGYTQTLASVSADVSNHATFAEATDVQLGFGLPGTWLRQHFATEGVAASAPALARDHMLGIDPTVAHDIRLTILTMDRAADAAQVTLALTDAGQPLATQLNGRLTLLASETLAAPFSEMADVVIERAWFDNDGRCALTFTNLPAALFLRARIGP